MDYAVFRQSVKILFFVRCLRCLKICTANPLISFIFSSPIYASFGHSANCRNIYKKLSNLRAKNGESPLPPPKKKSFSTLTQLRFSLNVLTWFIYLSKTKTTILYLSNDMLQYFVLVYCCIFMLITSCFWGCHSNFGTQNNYKNVRLRNLKFADTGMIMQSLKMLGSLNRL